MNNNMKTYWEKSCTYQEILSQIELYTYASLRCATDQFTYTQSWLKQLAMCVQIILELNFSKKKSTLLS